MTGPDHTDGRQHLHGWRVRDYDDAIARLGRSLEEQGITQTALGQRLGRHKQQISQWILGDVEMLSSSLFALADALGYDLALIPRQPATGDDT